MTGFSERMCAREACLDESRCYFCGHVTRPWMTDDETWALVAPLLGQHQVCLACFFDALVELGQGMQWEPLRVSLPERKCSCTVGSYDQGRVHESYCRLAAA